MNIRIFFTLLVAIILSTCTKSNNIAPTTPHPSVAPPPPIQHEIKKDSILQRFLQQHNIWQGTPHRIGGYSREGIDCSGFTQITFLQLFKRKLPRTTVAQSKLGNKVLREHLQTGDLLFFKTGWFSRHVGIYLHDRKFLHASTSKGVIISSLEENYWKNNFYLAKRINIH